MVSLRSVFDRQTNLTVHLSKTNFGKAEVTYLGHTIGYGKVFPVDAKIQGILDVRTPNNVKSLKQFLGMVGYYRKVCNFSVVAPLIQLLTKKSSLTKLSSCYVLVQFWKLPSFHNPSAQPSTLAIMASVLYDIKLITRISNTPFLSKV